MNKRIADRIAKREAEILRQRAEEEHAAVESFQAIIATFLPPEIQAELGVRVVSDEKGERFAEFVLEGYTYRIICSPGLFFTTVMSPDGSIHHHDSVYYPGMDLSARIVEIAAYLHLGRTPVYPEGESERTVRGTIHERILQRAKEILEKEEADRHAALQAFRESFSVVMPEKIQRMFGIRIVDEPDEGAAAVAMIDEYYYRIIRQSDDFYWINTARKDGSDGHSDAFIVGEGNLEGLLIEIAALTRVR
jgi:hypothetical protein